MLIFQFDNFKTKSSNLGVYLDENGVKMKLMFLLKVLEVIYCSAVNYGKILVKFTIYV